MSNQAKTVLWIGLILIVVQLVQQWAQIKSIIFTPSTPIAGAGSNLPFAFNPLGIPFSTIASPIVPSITPPKAAGSGVTKNPGSTFPKICPGGKIVGANQNCP